MTRERNYPIKRLLYMVAIFIVLAVTTYYAYNVIAVEIVQKQVEAEHEALMLEKAELEDELKNVSDPKYIEQQARTQLRMISPGEVLYILPDMQKEQNENN